MSTELAIVIKASALTGVASTAIRALGGSMDALGKGGALATSKLGREYSLLTRRAQNLNSKLFDVDAFAASKRINERLGESYAKAQDKAQQFGQSLAKARQFADESKTSLAAFRNELSNQTGKATDAQKLKLQLLGEQAKGAQNDMLLLSNRFRDARDRVKELDARLSESALHLQKNREELSKNGIATAQLASHKTQLIKQLELEQSRIGALGKTYAALERKQSVLQGLQAKRTALQEHGSALKSEALGAAGAVGVIAFPLKAAMEFESKMANVKKVVTFDTPAQFKQMGDDVMALTRTIPLAGTELASIVAQGGQAGIARENLIGFTTDAAKMGIAFDMAASEAGTAMAGLSNVLKIPIANIGKLGDKINYVADNANSNSRDIVNVITRVGAATKQFGLTDNFAVALSSTYLSMNKPPELAAQAINGMMQTMSLAKVGEFDSELKKLGLTTKGFGQAVDKNADAALQDLLARVKKLPQKEQYPFLISMFGKNYADDIMLITSNTEELNRQVNLLTDTGTNGKPLFDGSMSREFENQSATSTNQLTLFKNGLTELAKTVGDTMLPAFNDLLVNTLIPLSHELSDFMQKNPGFAKGLVGVVAALAAFKVGGFAVRAMLHGLNTLTLGGRLRYVAFTKALLQGKGALQSMRLGLGLSNRALIRQNGALGSIARGYSKVSRFALNAASSVKKFAGTKLGKTVGKGLGAAAGAYGLYDIYKQDKNAGAKNQTTGQKVASYAQGAASGAAIGAMFGPMGAVVGAALGLIYTAVVRNFDAIKTYIADKIGQVKLNLAATWTEISNHPAQALARIGAIILNWSPLGLFVNAFAGVLSWFGVTLPASFSNFGTMIIDGLVNSITAGVSRVVTAIKNVAVSGIEIAKSTFGINSPSRVFRKIGGGLTHGLDLGVIKGATRPLSTIGTFADNLQQRFKNRAGQLQSTLTARMQSNAAELAQAQSQPRPSSAASGANAGSYVIHYSPQISAPNGHVEQVKEALRLSQREFESMFEHMMAGQARRSY